MSYKSFHIDDPLDRPEQGAVEVRVTFENGDVRWCYFMTPDRLAAVGDFVEGTSVRLHYGSHMIVVSEISEEIIAGMIKMLDQSGELIDCTRLMSD